jgi:hypothetical protein
MGYPKTQNVMLIPNLWNGLKQLAEKSYRQKTKENSAKSEKTQNSHSIFLTLFSGTFLSPFQRIPKQHKILRFLIPIPTMAFTKKENSGS